MEISLVSGLSNLFTKNHRKQNREFKKLPVKVHGDDAKAVTRDFSLSGVYFETGSFYQVGSMIKMTIDFDSPRGMQLECEGTIVRVETHGSDKAGVAVHMNPLRSELTQSPKSGPDRTRTH